MKSAVSVSALGIVFLASVFLASYAAGQRPELVVQVGHTNTVQSVAFGLDGRTLVSCGDDGSLKLWDVATGRELRSLVSQSGVVYSVAFSPNGQTLASSDAKTVKLWDVASGRELLSLVGHTSHVSSVAFSPDGRTLASGSWDKTVKLWDVASGSELRTLASHRDAVNSVAFSPDGRTLASGSGRITIPGLPFDSDSPVDYTIKLWDVASGRELRTLASHTDMVHSVAFSPEGRTLASASSDKTIKLWDVASGRELRSLVGHSDVVYTVAFNPDGRTLVSGSLDKTIRLWDVSSGQMLHTLAGHSGTVVFVAFSPDGRTLASASVDKAIKLWDVASTRELRNLGGHTDSVDSVAFSPDGRTLASGNYDATIKVWDVASGSEVRSLSGHTEGIRSIAFSRDGRALLSGSYDNNIKLWDVASGRELRKFAPSTSQLHSVFGSEAFSPDGRTVASGIGDTIKLWDMASGSPPRTLTAPTDYPHSLRSLLRPKPDVYSIAFSPNGKTLASSGSDKTIRLWDVSSGRELRGLSAHTDGDAHNLVFSPNGRILAASERIYSGDTWNNMKFEETIELWDVESGRKILSIGNDKHGSGPLAFSPDGQIVASRSSNDNGIRLWNVASGRELRKLDGHTFPVSSVAFSPDSQWLISGSPDGTTRVWEVDTGQLAATLTSSNNSTDWLVVTPGGLFDGSPQAWNQILWRFNNNTFDVAPVEIFFREYYYPGLLTDVLAGKHPKATSDIANIDRRQPVVVIERTHNEPANQALEPRTVKLHLQVSEAPPDVQHKVGSGVRDARLFRNGALVKVWRGDLQLDPQGRTVLEAELPVVAGENRFTAYAFSKSDTKSSDATITVTGAASLKRGGVGYVLAVGVNEYANKDYDLKYAVGDAKEFASVFSGQQRKLQNYAALKTTYLLNSDATKANILAALERLAGASADKLTPTQQKLFADLAPAQPEDGVFIYYAGHGYAHGQRFYLLPHDMVMPERGEDFAKPEAHTVSDLELGDVFEKIGAGRSLFVIDACRSGQALEAEEKRRGPMNSKGLAQLAYEKGMYILTASQSYQSALESAELGGGHGFLTYALVEKGLKTREAAVDGQVELRHWLDFATQLVPQLQLASMQEAQKQGRRLVVVSGEDEESASPEQRTLQRPRVFYRRETEAQPFIVARP